MSILRPYQTQALAAFRAALSPEVNRVAIEMATGLGKTVTGAQAAVDFLEQPGSPGEIERPRVLVLVPTDEICQQWVTKLELAVSRSGHPWTIGVVKAERNEPDADIVVASVWTLAQSGRREQIKDVGFIVLDEAHHAVTPTSLAILEHYGAFAFRGVPHEGCLYRDETCEEGLCCRITSRDATPVLGLSATLKRSDGQGLGRVWQEMPFSRSLSWAIRKGYLIDLVPYTIKIPGLDAAIDGASTYPTAAVLDAELAEGIAPEAVVQAWAEKARPMCAECLDAMEQVSGDVGHTVVPAYCPNPDCQIMDDAPSTVLFAPLVKSAQAFADAFNAAGVKAEVVHGKMSEAEVAAVMARYKAGVTTVVCNAMKLTEGWDSPRTMCVIVARPTKSVPLFVQMVGRGLRPWLGPDAPPREDQRCILLCVQGTAMELATVADLSDNVGDVREGESFLAMEDRWDLGKDIPDEDTTWSGPVRVERWDPLVQASSKAWKYTEAGAAYLPTAKRGQGYVFIIDVPQPTGTTTWEVWHYGPMTNGGRRLMRVARLATAPDFELALAVAEDEAQERGGDVGALLADKGRPWRKGVPTPEAQAEARRLGLGSELDRILAQRASGKAGKLSDRMDIVTASKRLDPQVAKIKERGSRA